MKEQQNKKLQQKFRIATVTFVVEQIIGIPITGKVTDKEYPIEEGGNFASEYSFTGNEANDHSQSDETGGCEHYFSENGAFYFGNGTAEGYGQNDCTGGR